MLENDIPLVNQLNQEQFGALVEPYRRVLQAHCYRMLGSIQDAEDLVQETFLRAWRRRETFAGRASFHAWLYKIATHACLDALAKRPRRFVPQTRQAAATADEPIPASIMEPIWLEPYPDEWLIASDDNPEIYLAGRENISLAFMAALQLLPARQRAVLILRDVLDWQTNEVADLLEMTPPAVKSALHRARVTLAKQAYSFQNAIPVTGDELSQAQLNDYMQAWENADINALLHLLKADATFSMPPIPSWYQGHSEIRALTTKTIFSGTAQGRWRLLPTRANGQLAFGLYRQSDNPNVYDAYGLQVLTCDQYLIADIITFRNPDLAAIFKLPAILTR